MKVWPMMVLVAGMVAVCATGQEQPAKEPSAPASPPTTFYDSAALIPLPHDPALVLEEPNKLEINPPGNILTRPLRALSPGNLLRLPWRVLKSLNPFSGTPASETAGAFGGSLPMNASRSARKEPVQEKAHAGDLNPRAWTSIVGWHPGGSAFYDPITFEW